jgi:hypothetical protein
MKNLLPLPGAVAIALLASVSIGVLSCSMDLLPIGKARILSAQRAHQPLPRGPQAPGAFSKVLSFASPGGFLLDSVRVDISGGGARLKPIPGQTAVSRSRTEVIQTSKGFPFATLHEFAETSSTPAIRGKKGELRYQLSRDGTQWYFHDGKQWVPAVANSSQSNLAPEVQANVGRFDIDVGPGTLFVKIYLVAPTGREPAELRELRIAGVAPRDDSFD